MCSRPDDPTQHDASATGVPAELGSFLADHAEYVHPLAPCPQCGALGWVEPCSECGYPAINADTEHVCADGTVILDTAAPVASNEHGDAWCAKCGERLLLPEAEVKA